MTAQNNSDIALAEKKQEKGLLDKAKNTAAKALTDIGMKEENIRGTDAQKEKSKQLARGREVIREWDDGETLYSQLFNDMEKFRSFYMGDNHEQGVSDLEGDVRVTANLGATVIDLFTYLLTNNPPDIQFDPQGADEISQTEANYKEELTRRLLKDAKFQKRFRDAAKTQFMIGWTVLYPFWNKQREDGGKNGTFDLTVLNNFRTRVRYKTQDSEQIESFITTKRMSPAAILDQYDYEALPDSTVPHFLPESWEAEDDGMTTVFTRYGAKDIRIVINGREIKRIKHDLGFCPAIQVDNIKVPNDIHGHSEIERWQDVLKEVNKLLSAVSEIARDKGYPPLIEYNNALGNRKIPKWRGQKIPAKRSERGEALEYLVNPGQIAPLLEQVQMLIELFHFVSLMPKAAAGIFQSNITSGFQAKLAMQPATLTTESRKIDWEIAIKEMIKMAFDMMKKYDPETLKIKINENKQIEITDVYLHEMDVIWPENLPQDIAREIQNLVLGIQHGLTSVQQSIDRYNALMGMGSPSDTEDNLKEEAEDALMNPDRALKVAKVKQTLEQMSNDMKEANAKMGEMRQKMKGGMPENLKEAARQSNPTNLSRSASSKLPEEQRNYPENAEEAVPPESKGGQV